MANGQYIGVNGVARKVVSPYIGVNAVARKVTAGYVGVNGVARLFFAPESGKVILEVKKVTSDTHVNDTAYENEEFILLDIYPKTGGTVTVTYGDLTKTITDTSGAEEPNAQQVFFGTFNGVSDSVTTPTSGTLTIEGEYSAFAKGIYDATGASKVANLTACDCIVAVSSWGNVDRIPREAFYAFAGLTLTTLAPIPNEITSIGINAFYGNFGITEVTFENTSGWYVAQTEGATSGTAVDVSDPATNVILLTKLSAAETNPGYVDYYWYRA